MAEDITWQDPPPVAGKMGQYGRIKAILQACRENPGRWALAGTYAQSGTNVARLKLQGFEATGRRREDGRFDVYVRFPVNGDKS